jgi:hypothetical protein
MKRHQIFTISMKKSQTYRAALQEQKRVFREVICGRQLEVTDFTHHLCVSINID